MFWEGWPDLKWAHDWQSLIAGVLGFAAAIIVVVLTLLSERRRDERATQAMRRALLSEMWGMAGQALDAHKELSAKLSRGEQIRLHDLEEAARFPALVIYPNIAGKLGALGEDAHNIVVFHQRLQALKDTVDRVRRNKMEMENPADFVEALLNLAETASVTLPTLRVSRADGQADPNFAVAVGSARREWDRFKAGK